MKFKNRYCKINKAKYYYVEVSTSISTALTAHFDTMC